MAGMLRLLRVGDSTDTWITPMQASPESRVQMRRTITSIYVAGAAETESIR